jgi:hypothetical protein
MKIGVRTTPPAGTPVATTATQALPASVTHAPPPSMTQAPLVSAKPVPPLGMAQTPAPVLTTPEPIVLRSSGSFRRPPAPAPAITPPGSGATARSLVIGGLCMIAFSCGVMCTIAVDRLWPRAHAQCVGAPPAGPGAAPVEAPGAAPAPDIQAAAAPASPMAVTPLPPPESILPSLPSPAEGAVVAPARKIVAAASAAVPATRPVRSAAVARVQPAQGRAVVRKRPASTSSLPVDTMSPSGLWVDPFAE